MLDWLAAQHASTATFLGTLCGSLLGFVTLLVGVLVNASANRARDEAQRQQEVSAIRSALRIELAGIGDSFKKWARHGQERKASNDREYTAFLIANPSSLVRVLPTLLSKLYLLPPDEQRQIMETYVSIEHVGPSLVLLGATEHNNELHLQIPNKVGDKFAAMVGDLAGRIDFLAKQLQG